MTLVRRLGIAAALAALLALVAAGCGSSAGGGGVIIRGTTDEPISYDPAGAYDLPSYDVIYAVYQNVMTIPPGKSTPVPEAAEKCDYTNPKTYECTLKPDLKFSDGSALTSKDVIRHVSDRIAVMYLGKIVELGPAEEVYSRPIHPYTLSLLSALPIPDPKANAEREQIVLEGDIPSPANPPAACRFHTRCPYATEICSQEEPALVNYGNDHWAACHHPLHREHPEAVAEALPELDREPA